MAKFRTEPPAAPTARVGVLLCNLGTPEAPTAQALRPYLAEFLSDPRVIELPAALWRPILHGVILRTRPAKSAEKYRSIWTPEGSPLAVWTEKQATLLRGYLAQRGLDLRVRHAMRYGRPQVAAELDQLKAEGCDRILVLPLYPQYAASTVGSVMDAVAGWMRSTRSVPELRLVRDFCTDARYITALAQSVTQHWQQAGRPDKLLMSFHGVPKRMIDLGDPYQQQCRQTAAQLASRLGLAEDEWLLSFQSRFGPAKWIGPATDATLEELGKTGLGRLDVICPGFVSDCLETLEEIAMEGKEIFEKAGGKQLRYIACLNDRPAWIHALADLVQTQTQGWPVVRQDGSAGAA